MKYKILSLIFVTLLSINCYNVDLKNCNEHNKLIKEFIIYFKQKKILEPSSKDTIFITANWDSDKVVKYYFYKDSLHITNKNTKCDYKQRYNNCVNLFNFKFEDSKFKKVDFELTNASTILGYLVIEEWGLDHKVISEITK